MSGAAAEIAAVDPAPGGACKRFAAGKTLAQAEFTSAEHVKRVGPPRGWPRGGPYFRSMLGGSEFRLRQGFALGKTLVRATWRGGLRRHN